MSTSLRSARWAALNAIDEAAGRARRRYRTDITGQEEAYEDKATEASAFLAAHAAGQQAEAGPYISAEATRRGVTCLAVAEEVMQRVAAYNSVKHLIEAERTGGKAEVRAAADQDVDAQRDAAIAALDAFNPWV